MSDEPENIPIVEEKDIVEPEKPKTRKKNPNRVKQGLKLAAIGQKAKEEKMRKRVKDEMIKPSTWIGVGGALASVTLLGFWWFSNSIGKPEENSPQKKEEPKKMNYFD